MPDNSIKPALSPEEWTDALNHSHGLSDYVVTPAEMLGYSKNSPQDMARVAALCLYGQSFGFTWDDVDALREPGTFDDGHNDEKLNAIADRIAALLPPRNESVQRLTRKVK